MMKHKKIIKYSGIFTLIEAVVYTGINIFLTAHILSLLRPPEWMKEYVTPHIWKTYFDSGLRCGPPLDAFNQTASGTTELSTFLDSSASLIYQLIYTGAHFCWIFLSCGLIIGSTHSLWALCIPWLIVTPILLMFDLLVSAMYIFAISHDMKLGNEENITSYILLVLFYSRAGIGWLLNLTSFILTIRASVKLEKKAGAARRRKNRNSIMSRNSIIRTPVSRQCSSDYPPADPFRQPKDFPFSTFDQSRPVSNITEGNTSSLRPLLPKYKNPQLDIGDKFHNGSIRNKSPSRIPSLPMTNYVNGIYNTVDDPHPEHINPQPSEYYTLPLDNYFSSNTLKIGHRPSKPATTVDFGSPQNYNDEEYYSTPYDSVNDDY